MGQSVCLVMKPRRHLPIFRPPSLFVAEIRHTAFFCFLLLEALLLFFSAFLMFFSIVNVLHFSTSKITSLRMMMKVLCKSFGIILSWGVDEGNLTVCSPATNTFYEKKDTRRENTRMFGIN